MKRILLHEDENLLNEISFDLNQYIPLLQKVKTSYETLELDNFCNDILKEITLGGIKNIKNNFNKNLEKQIENLKVTNSVLKENLLKGSQLVFQNFEETVKELKRFKPETYSRVTGLKLQFISYKNEVFYLSKKDKESILENDCRIYLENEGELGLHKDLMKFIEAYEKVSNNLKDMKFKPNYRFGEEITGISKVFLEFNDGKYSIIPGSIKYASNYNENSLRNS